MIVLPLYSYPCCLRYFKAASAAASFASCLDVLPSTVTLITPLTEQAHFHSEPVHSEPVDSEPVDSEPVDSEPVNSEPVNSEPVNSEPVNSEPVGSDKKKNWMSRRCPCRLARASSLREEDTCCSGCVLACGAYRNPRVGNMMAMA